MAQKSDTLIECLTASVPASWTRTPTSRGRRWIVDQERAARSRSQTADVDLGRSSGAKILRLADAGS